jgi:uncharacterized membrane protein
MFDVAVRDVVSTRQSRRGLVGLLSITGLIASAFTFTRGLPYFFNTTSRYSDRRVWLLIHIAAGAAAILAGPVQLWLGLAGRRVEVHRRLGFIYMASVAVGSVAAFALLGLRSNPQPGFSFGLAGLATAWIGTTGMAFLAIRRGLVEQHKEWMIRSYVVTFAFVGFRVIVPALSAAGVSRDQGAIAAWACWAVPLLITELILQGRKILAVAR